MMLPGPWATAGRSYAETTLGTSFDPRALRGTRWSDEVRLYVASHAIFKSRQFRFELFELTLQELHARPKTLRLDMIPPWHTRKLLNFSCSSTIRWYTTLRSARSCRWCCSAESSALFHCQ